LFVTHHSVFPRVGAPQPAHGLVDQLGPGVGEALESLREADGSVLAVFARTATIRAANGRLLVLHGPDVPLTPFSIQLSAPPVAWPAVGTPARLWQGRLVVGDLRVELPSADEPRQGNPSFSPFRSAARRAARAELAPEVFQALASWAAQSAFGCWWIGIDPASVTMAEHVKTSGARQLRRLVEALRHGDQVQASAAAQRLLGLGPGLTPSGDDALIGLLACWERLDLLLLGGGLRNALLRQLDREAAIATTPVSAEFIHHLARGQVAEPLAELTEALAGDDPLRITRAAAWLAQWGHSSGRDAISGVVALLLAARPASPPWSAAPTDRATNPSPGRLHLVVPIA
jgi:hypothetical protein